MYMLTDKSENVEVLLWYGRRPYTEADGQKNDESKD